MGAANLVGGFLGARTAISRGNAFIRRVFLLVLAGLVIRLGYDVVRQLVERRVSRRAALARWMLISQSSRARPGSERPSGDRSPTVSARAVNARPRSELFVAAASQSPQNGARAISMVLIKRAAVAELRGFTDGS